MKLQQFKRLVKEITLSLQEETNADNEIKKAKKIVGDKLKGDKDLSAPEAEIAMSNADPDSKNKISRDLSTNVKLEQILIRSDVILDRIIKNINNL